MNNVVGLTCVICDTTYPADFAGYVCPDHGNEGILDVSYDYDLIGETFTKESLAADPRSHHVAVPSAAADRRRRRGPAAHRRRNAAL